MKTEAFVKEWARLKDECAEPVAQPLFYKPGAKWTDRELVKRGVPKGYGVYVLFGLRKNHEDELLYIGMSGSVDANGAMKEQGLARRLVQKAFTANKRAVKRVAVFEYLVNAEMTDVNKTSELIAGHYSGINQGKYEQLRIEWIETYKDGKGILPRLAEAYLLSAYVLENRDFPPLNKEF